MIRLPVPCGFGNENQAKKDSRQASKSSESKSRAPGAISGLPGAEIAKYFREHPDTARALPGGPYEKRYTPSTFISENGAGSFRVGWFTREAKYDAVKEFQNLADATDYLFVPAR
jgi:ADP-heptose:LPS heptosyltransferase